MYNIVCLYIYIYITLTLIRLNNESRKITRNRSSTLKGGNFDNLLTKSFVIVALVDLK
jgi:hypothetical protein